MRVATHAGRRNGKGDKVLTRGTRHLVNRAATARRIAATTLVKSQTYLGAQYRRLRSKLGAPKAISAMAHRLARVVYRVLKYGQQNFSAPPRGSRALQPDHSLIKSAKNSRHYRTQPGCQLTAGEMDIFILGIA